MEYGWGTGLERATGTLASTGMGLLQMKQQQEHQRILETNQSAQLQIANERLKMEQATAKRADEEFQKKQEAFNRLLDIKTHPLYLSLPESAQQKALKYYSSNNFTNEQGIGKTGEIEQGTMLLEKTKTIFGDIMGDVVKAKYDGVIEAWNKFKTTQSKVDKDGKPDKEKTAQARAEYDRLNADYQASAGNFTKHIEGLTAQESKEELERIKAENKQTTPDMQTLYGPGGATKRVAIPKSGTYTPEPGWSLKAPPLPKEVTPGQSLTAAHAIRTELRSNPYIRDFQDVDNKFSVMEKALAKSKTTKNFVAVDQALITLFNKMTDPQSVVRESEYARTPENIGFVNRIKGKAEKIMSGGAGLTSEERNALSDMGREFYNVYLGNYNKTISDYEALAKESGINSKLIGLPYPKKGTKTNKPITAEDYLKSIGR